jgi:hypothetical protein
MKDPASKGVGFYCKKKFKQSYQKIRFVWILLVSLYYK